MGERTVRAGGFRLTAEAPDRFTSAVRRLARRKPPAAGGVLSGGLVLRPAPPVNFERRDPEAGLTFVRERLKWRADHHQDAPPDLVEDGPDDLARRVAGR